MNMILGLIMAAIFVYIGVNKVCQLVGQPASGHSVNSVKPKLLKSMVIPSQAEGNSLQACVETRDGTSILDASIVRHSMKVEITERNLEPGLVNSPFIQRWVKQTANIGGKLRCSRRGIVLQETARNDYQAVSLVDKGIVSSAMNDEIAVKNNVNTTVATITTPTYSSGVAGLNGVKRKNSAIRWRHLMQTVNIGGSLKWLSRHTASVMGKVLTTTKRRLFETVVWSALQRISKLQLTQRNHDSLRSHKIIVASRSNPCRITHQIRGNLNPARGMAIAELSRKLYNFWACGETRWCASPWDGGIVRT